VPPTVVRTTPSEGASSVDVGSSVEIEFSEEMDRLSVERSFSIVPAVELRNLRWRGRTLVVEPKTVFPDSATVVMQIGSGAQDYHSVAIDAPLALAFSTGDAVDSGIISGSVETGGEPTGGAVVWACAGHVTPDSTGVYRQCGYATSSASDGSFRLLYVRPRSTAYSIVAFVDGDGNRAYTPESEIGGMVERAALVESPGDSAVGISVEIEEPAATETETSPAEGRPETNTEEGAAEGQQEAITGEEAGQ
jgi:hypothetical protein